MIKIASSTYPSAVMTLSVIHCFECRSIHPPPEQGWACPDCGGWAEYGLFRNKCVKCGNSCLWQRTRLTYTCMCPCLLNQQQKAARANAIAERNQREAAEAEAESERAAKVVSNIDLAKGAAMCWDVKLQDCSLPKDKLPFAFCPYCPRFKKPSCGKRRGEVTGADFGGLL